MNRFTRKIWMTLLLILWNHRWERNLRTRRRRIRRRTSSQVTRRLLNHSKTMVIPRHKAVIHLSNQINASRNSLIHLRIRTPILNRMQQLALQPPWRLRAPTRVHLGSLWVNLAIVLILSVIKILRRLWKLSESVLTSQETWKVTFIVNWDLITTLSGSIISASSWRLCELQLILWIHQPECMQVVVA